MIMKNWDSIMTKLEENAKEMNIILKKWKKEKDIEKKCILIEKSNQLMDERNKLTAKLNEEVQKLNK